MASIAGSAVCVSAVLAHTFLRADLSAVRDPISAYAHGAYGYLQVATFLVIGLASIALAWALWLLPSRALRHGWPYTAACALIALWGTAMMACSVVDTDDLVLDAPGRLHDLIVQAGFVFLVAGMLLASVTSRCSISQSLKRISRPWAVASVAILTLTALGQQEAWFGLAERLLALCVISWVIAAAYVCSGHRPARRCRLVRQAGESRGQQQTGGTVRSSHMTAMSPVPRDLWSQALKSSPEALAFHTPEWLSCICAGGAYEDASLAYETVDDRMLILPLVRRRWLPTPLTTEASPPYGWGSVGPISTDPIRREDLEAILLDLARRGVLRVTVRPNPLAERGAAPPTPRTVLVPLRAFVLDLEGGYEHVWTRRFKPDVRTRVRKAARRDMVVESDSEGRLVPVFHDLYLKSVDRWAHQGEIPSWLLRPYLRHHESRRKFEVVGRTMQEACRIWVARVDGKPAAAIIVLTLGANAYYWRGAMDKDLAGPTRANYLLQARAIAQACHDGCRWYQMGETGFGEGLARFKAGFGAAPHDYVEYRIERLPLTDVRNRLRDAARRATLSRPRMLG